MNSLELFFSVIFSGILLWALIQGGNALILARRWQQCLKEAARIVGAVKAEYPGCEGARNEYLEQRINFFNPPQFNLATNTILGTAQRWSIDRTWPIEEIYICVNYDVTTGFTTTSPTTPDMYDNILALLQRVTLEVNDGRQPRKVVDVSGVGLLEYASQVGWNLSAETLTQVAISNNIVGALAVPVGVYQQVYRIPCTNPLIGEPLRSRLYLPVHTYPQDPVLTLQFNSMAGMGAPSTGAIGTIRVDVVLIRRLPTPESEAYLRATGAAGKYPLTNPSGYIDWDLIETPYSIPLGTATEQRLAIATPGNYINGLVRQYKGGAALTRNKTIDVDVGDTIANNLGLETKWRLETGGTVVKEFRWKHLRFMNDQTRPATPLTALTAVAPTLPTPTNQGFVAIASAGSPTIQLSNQAINFPGGMQAATANYRAATSVMLNFITDGVSGEVGNELGSLLDCNTPANNGLKMELIGTPASVATNPSVLFWCGHRLFGDIRKFQAF